MPGGSLSLRIGQGELGAPVSKRCPKECPKHTASVRASGEHRRGRTPETGYSTQPGSGAKAEGLQGPGRSPALGPRGLLAGLCLMEQRPHLCHLDHVGELSETGDGDDVVVCPALGPGRRKPTLRSEEGGKGDGSPAPASKTRRDRPPGGPEGRRGLAWLSFRKIAGPLWASMRGAGKLRQARRPRVCGPPSCRRPPPRPHLSSSRRCSWSPMTSYLSEKTRWPRAVSSE